MPAVWEQRFADWLKRVLGLRESTSLTALPDLMPVLDVMNNSPELAILRGERWANGSIVSAAVAGQGGAAQLRNTTTDRLYVVEEVWLSCSVATEWGAYRTGLALLALATVGLYTDPRRGDTSTGQVIEAGQNAAFPALASWVRRVRAPANIAQLWQPGYVLPPGHALRVEIATVNQAFEVSFRWRERSVGSQEMNLA